MGKYAVENTPLGRTRRESPGVLSPLDENYNVKGGHPAGARGLPRFDDYNDPGRQATPRPNAPPAGQPSPFKVGGG
jgi:hypothetical protein